MVLTENLGLMTQWLKIKKSKKNGIKLYLYSFESQRAKHKKESVYVCEQQVLPRGTENVMVEVVPFLKRSRCEAKNGMCTTF